MSSPPKKRQRKEEMAMRPQHITAQHPADAPPPIKGPTAKERKYDRQLRLWAAAGQTALEDAHILLLNAGPGVVGVETLKNLVLPGIGQFTIHDAAQVTEADLGVNFFLDEEDLGKSRAAGCVRLLQELNPDVRGYAITEPLESFLTDPDALSPYTHILVILPVAKPLLELITSHATLSSTPLFLIHSLGFYSHFTLSLPPAFPIVDTHPDPQSTTDLRLLSPWPELAAFAAEKTSSLAALADDDHSHLPYLVILLYALSQWRDAHNGSNPGSYSDKSEFRKFVLSLMRTGTDEGPTQENFEEAAAAVLKAIAPHTPSSSTLAVLTASETQDPQPDSNPFFLIANAVNTFLNVHGTLPLPGSLPDMKARSADYVALQTLYKRKARTDAQEVLASVRKLEAELNRPASAAVPEVEVERFCKAANTIKLVRGRRPAIAPSGTMVSLGVDGAKQVVENLTDPLTGGVGIAPLFIAFLAYDSYAASHELQAGLTDPPRDGPEARAAKIRGIAETQLDALIKESRVSFIEDPEYSVVKAEMGKVVDEMVRADGGELHNVAALTGGMVAQEVIKVVTEQYVPVDNTCLFDGVHSRVGVLRI